ncbi:MAG TPA: response regulator transcription factor [Pyrinomonadaceae bacterium]|jgi:DNA-binding NarL/FixJ family response regulator|nr:response regulator transcription factor [Pyrinomonadaceae bacterium]
MIQLLLADDHVLMRRGIRDLLEADPDIQVTGEAGDGREAVRLAHELNPDVMIIDLTMPELNGLEAIRHIRKDCPEVELLVFSMHDSEELIREVFAAGARGYVLKSDASRYLVEAVKSLAQHKPFFTPRISEAILNALVTDANGKAETSSHGPLSSREREILQLLAENKSNKEIAARLGISVRTVETHRRSVMQKLDVNSIVELVHYAIRNGIVQPTVKLDSPPPSSSQ